MPENLILIPAFANAGVSLIKTALLQLYNVPVGKFAARKNVCFAGSGLSMAISHESEKQPPLTCTVPVTKLSLSFLHDVTKRNKMGMRR